MQSTYVIFIILTKTINIMREIHKKDGFYLTLLIALLIVSIALVTQYQKALFVEETGNIKIFGGLGILLAIGLVLRLKYVREILGAMTLLTVVLTTMTMINIGAEFYIAYGILLAALVAILSLLAFSQSVSNYLKSA